MLFGCGQPYNTIDQGKTSIGSLSSGKMVVQAGSVSRIADGNASALRLRRTRTRDHPAAPYVLLRREDVRTIRIYLNEVRYLAEAMCSMAAEVAGMITGDDDVGEVDGDIGTMVA